MNLKVAPVCCRKGLSATRMVASASEGAAWSVILPAMMRDSSGYPLCAFLAPEESFLWRNLVSSALTLNGSGMGGCSGQTFG
eukprot:CAMPEP_0174710432 /NCGR_PEP_ID=MMETSP1094-20130205/12074_1 /TAXON_ID=156173 /ORGANISM="Chrysochromulina brevifilum, Strain UTEX LB 985" /LENGTH=81 /DNA_ID=CAMNT_0015909241 /DNA_START=750 /DNA_END=995 /DNA_ORIENTATION=-